MASMALGVTPGVALAQSSPSNPIVGPATSASAAVAKEVSVMDIPRRANGSIDFDRWFTGKSKDEQKVLAKGLKTRADKESYTEYLDLQEKELDATIIAKRNE